MLASVRQAELHSKVYDIFSLPKSKLKTTEVNFPLSGLERTRLSKSMSVDELLDATAFHEDEDAKPRRRWREIQHFFAITRDPKYSKASIENALWHYVYNGVSATHFANAIIDEFGFPPEMRDDIDAHLKWLYWSFDGGTNNLADWRTIVATFRLMIFFKLIKRRPIELLISCFDIYAVSSDGKKAMSAHPNESWYIEDAFNVVTAIFTLPCETLGELKWIRGKIREAFLELYKVPRQFHEIHEFGVHLMYRKEFRQFLRAREDLVVKFADLCWARTPPELRLAYLDEEQVNAQHRSDIIMYRFKLMQAYAMYQRHLIRGSYNTWREAAKRNSIVSQFAANKFMRRRRAYFRFWRSMSAKIVLRRRRKLLAEVMGNYALKSRTFGRIRIFNFQTRYIFNTVGRFNKHAKTEKLGFMHLRAFWRLTRLRLALHRWWHETMYMINWDLAVEHDWARRLRPPLVRWQYDAHYDAMNKRIERLALENKFAFDNMMKEADVLALDIIKVEKEKIEKARIEEEAKEEIEKLKRQEEARQRVLKQKQEDERITLANQRELRRRRVKAQMKRIKQKFIAEAANRCDDQLLKAKNRIAAYVEEPGNKLAIEMRFERLKREFFEPPGPENKEREKILTSHKNIVFLYLDAKLRHDGLDMTKVIFKFDKEKRGFLTYDEFKNMIKALGVKLNPAQINAVIRGVDADGDGAIDLKELEESMQDIKKMGVEGSPWKLYVDAAQDVICYHNFDTGQKIFEYNMQDDILQAVNISNMYGEAETQAKKFAEESKKKDWELLMTTIMARRMQWMYKMWKLRKKRRAKLWSLQSQIAANRRRTAQKIVTFCEKTWNGNKSRALFKRELFLTYQKVYVVDGNDGKMFWFNHLLKNAVWERPHFMWRYGDVPMPMVWVPIDVPIPLPEITDAERASMIQVIPATANEKKKEVFVDTREQMYSLHYWHVKAKRDLPRKPDGIPACTACHRNLAEMKCVQCTTNFCFTCYRDSHASPYGFFQKKRPTPDQANDMGKSCQCFHPVFSHP